MAGFLNKVGNLVQSGVDKSKELAEITKLNLNISNSEDQIKTAKIAIGEYVVEHELLKDEENIAAFYTKIDDMKASIEADKAKINEIKNVGVCPNCGAAVGKDAKFCNKCGAPMPVTETQAVPTMAEQTPAVEKKVCPSCGQEIEAGTVFCPGCGAKIEG